MAPPLSFSNSSCSSCCGCCGACLFSVLNTQPRHDISMGRECSRPGGLIFVFFYLTSHPSCNGSVRVADIVKHPIALYNGSTVHLEPISSFSQGPDPIRPPFGPKCPSCSPSFILDACTYSFSCNPRSFSLVSPCLHKSIRKNGNSHHSI
jgi:hypothetical protein